MMWRLWTTTSRKDCTQLNCLALQHDSRHSFMCSEIKRLIYAQSHVKVKVTLYAIQSDNNCVFRALSLGLTGTEDQYQLLRAYITDRMVHDSVWSCLEQLFTDRPHQPLLEPQNYSDWPFVWYQNTSSGWFCHKACTWHRQTDGWTDGQTEIELLQLIQR